MSQDVMKGLIKELIPGAWAGGFLCRLLSIWIMSLFRIIKLGILDVRQYVCQESFRQVFRHGKVHIQIVAAVTC